MSSSDTQRAQIMFHLYTKLFNVVGEARNTTNPSSAQKLDKWFNMEIPDCELFTKDNREVYKAVPPRRMEIQVLLTVPELGHNEVLVHLPPNSSRVRIQPVPRFVLLETYILDVIPGPPTDVPLATIYKHCILLFRSLFTLLRVLPAWKLYKRLRRRTASLGITLRHERERVASLPHTPDPTSQGRTGPIPLHVRQTSLSRPEDPAISTSTSTSSTSASGMRKRYSSSFGHRYATPPSPSSPSMPTSSPSTARPAPINTSSSPRPLSFSPSSPSFPRPIPRRTDSTGGNGRSSIGNRVRTDDEDISAFVQDIDMRKPLVGGRGRGCESDRDRELGTVLQQQQPKQTTGFDSSQFKSGSSTNPEPALSSSSQHAHAHAQSPPERQVLTTEAEIDARLSKMNEAFLTSLKGLGSGASGVTGGSGRRREWARGRRTMSVDSTSWTGMPQGVLVRQGSQEVVGRMEMEMDGDGGGSGGVDLGTMVMRRGVGAGSGGGRFKF
ncbi:Autophagy-related protein 13 [Termitomyces sp. J132]|nr:Autophagy-related protein 13 [Termitomyces sp. J132]